MKQPAPVPEETAPDGNGDDGRAVAVADRMKKRRAPAFDAANNLPAVPYIYIIMYIRQTPAADSLPRMKKRRAPAFDVSNAFDTKKRRFLSLKFE